MSNQSFFSRIPPVTKNLIIINFIVWLAMFVLPHRLNIDVENFCAMHFYKSADFNPAQLFTYMFMHSKQTFAHIFFNMFTLFMFGGILERTLGRGRFLFYYISCGIGAAIIQQIVWALTWESSLATMMAQGYGVTTAEARELISQAMTLPSGMATGVGQTIQYYIDNMVTIGASGAIYGILLAFGMLYPNMPLFLFFIPIPIKAKYMVVGMAVIELLIGLSESVGVGDDVAHFAHLGGMIFGVFIILYWRRKGLFNNNGGYY